MCEKGFTFGKGEAFSRTLAPFPKLGKGWGWGFTPVKPLKSQVY